MDAYVAFFLEALETFRQLGDIPYAGHMEVGCLLVRTPCFGEGALGIMEEGVEP
jgi:hypothetical protein